MLTHVYQILQVRAAQQTGRPGTVALGAQEGLRWRTVDSRQLLDMVDSLANDLAGRGVRAGDRVVLWAPTGVLAPVYLFAIWKLGAVVVPFDRDMNPEAAIAILAAVEPRLVVLGIEQRPRWAPPDAVFWWEPAGLRDPGVAWQPPAEELAAIFFTSGTTGEPKGCMITHANLCSQIEAFGDRIPLDASCRLASILPLSHLFELTCGLLYPLHRGAAVHYIPSRRASDIVRVLQEQRITHMIAVPQLLTLMGSALEHRLRARLPGPIYRQVLDLADRLPMRFRRRLFLPVHHRIGGHLRLLVSGGAALPVATQRLWERLGVDVVQGYGTSECSPVVACGLPRITPPGSVGPPLGGVEVRLSAAGELQVRGPNVMRGYWRDSARTAEVLSPEGWYSTGDLADIDDHGNIWLRGRARDLIVLPNGMNVWPQDIEDELRNEPGVKDAVVLAAATSSGGARLHAYLVPDEPARRLTDPRAVVARVNSRLASHQRVASATWWPDASFPRTSTLKVQRHLLMPPTQRADEASGAAAVDGDPVADALATIAHTSIIRDDQSLTELGLDSLSLLEVAAQIEERLGRALAERALSTDMTVSDLREVVATAPAADDGAATEFESTQRLPVPPWFYRHGWLLRPLLTAPFDLLYRLGVPHTLVLGGEHLRELPSVTVFAGNHRSFADMPLVRVGLARTPARRFSRRLVVAVNADGAGWRSPLARYVAAVFGLYPLDRIAHRGASLRRLAMLARGGNAVLIFPQGIHARPADERGNPPAVRFKTGVAHVADALGAPVVPFGVAGTEVVVPAFRDGFQGLVIGGVPIALRRAVLAIAFGPPQRPARDETPQQFVERLERLSFELAARADAARAAHARRPAAPDVERPLEARAEPISQPPGPGRVRD
ncbi:MAG TPA: AMP-binding protein [Chloroflexota bacterium]